MRKILVTAFMVLTSLAATTQVSCAAQFSDGKEYKSVEQQATSTGDKIEILEFFWYGCPHCYSFEPHISGWLKTKPANVEFVRVPTVFRPDWKVHARTYYALEEMGKLEELHEKIFEQIHKHRKYLSKLEEMTAFLETQGVDKQAFTDAYNSFSVDGSMRKAIKKQSAYKITGVPTVIINGKYMTGGALAGTYEKVLEVMDYLIAKESAK